MNIHAIFTSIDGEVNYFGQGRFSTFIRLAGCNLRCKACDTPQALVSTCGKDMPIEYVVDKIKEAGCHKITITGGEPLLHSQDIADLMKALGNDYNITIETNGSVFPSHFSLLQNAYFVADYKLPSSGMEDMMDLSFLDSLRPRDFIKFVIADRADYERAKEVLNIFTTKAQIAFSSCMGLLEPATLLKWMEADKLYNILFNVQIHKLIDVD